MKCLRILIIPLVVSLILTACTFEGSRHPVTLKFSWFSYLNGDDIRPRCSAGAPDEYRFIYNGVYTEQVRMYDVFPAPDEDDRYIVEARVTGQADVSTVAAEYSRFDLFAPWRAVESKINVRQEDIEKLNLSLKSSGLFSEEGHQGDLSSIQFYWIVSGCFDGKYIVRSFVWPEQAFQEADFPKLLMVWDFTQIPLNLPRKTSLFEIYGTNDQEDHLNLFTIRVGKDRIN